MQIVLRAGAVYFLLWVVSRAVGRRELAELSAFELLMLVILGDLIQQGVTQSDTSVTGAMLAVSTIAILSVLTSYIAFRWPKTANVIDGIPVLIVNQGEVLNDVLRMERVSKDDVLTAARNVGIDDITKVRAGIIESDGRFSFVRFDDAPIEPDDHRAE